jgi:hypothetical protein
MYAGSAAESRNAYPAVVRYAGLTAGRNARFGFKQGVCLKRIAVLDNLKRERFNVKPQLTELPNFPLVGRN